MQEGYFYDKRLCGYASRCQFPLFPVPIPVSPSTKSGFLCFFGLRDPRFQAFRAQNRGFCALLGFVTLVFGHFEHKIGVFVRFWGLEPSFSGISSTKSRFLCAFSLRDPRFRAVRAQNRGFCALLASGTLVFGLFEYKIGVFVLVKLMCGIGRSAILNFCARRAKSLPLGGLQF